MDNELLRKYELMVIVDAKLNHEEKNSIFKDVNDAISKNGGKLINSQVWMEKHKLTFDIKKCKEGTYYLINYVADGSVNAKVKNAMKLNERVLRFSMTKAVAPVVAELAKQ